jgi:L-aspartate oxidase
VARPGELSPNQSDGDLDLLVLGSGVAGLSAVVRAASRHPGARIGLVSKGVLSDSATQWAQGGVAAVMHQSDSVELHMADTLKAGCGLCDHRAVEVLVTEGPQRVRELAGLGASFDRDDQGDWELAREGGHSTARVVHAGGAATGAEVERTLVEAAGAAATTVWEHTPAVDLIVEGGKCRGVAVTGGTDIRARATLLATGGAGQLYSITTNPPQATADGLAMAMRAGVAVADLEFVQFHPTALHGPAGNGPRPLLSEAVRGEGAVLRDAKGQRFVDELQPRDVVAAAVAASIRQSRVDHVWLDVGPVPDFEARFPTLAAAARAAGLDPSRDWLPVAPAAHYMCGGVLTDLDAATSLPGLWAAGEVACPGVHGANRLASNSLLDGLVFGARAADAALSGKEGPVATGALGPLLDPSRCRDGSLPVEKLSITAPTTPARAPADPAKARESLQRAMTEGAGVLRSATTLDSAQAELRAVSAGGASGELANLLIVAEHVVAFALARRESRGGHRRSDFPETSESLTVRFAAW